MRKLANRTQNTSEKKIFCGARATETFEIDWLAARVYVSVCMMSSEQPIVKESFRKIVFTFLSFYSTKWNGEWEYKHVYLKLYHQDVSLFPSSSTIPLRMQNSQFLLVFFFTSFSHGDDSNGRLPLSGMHLPDLTVHYNLENIDGRKCIHSENEERERERECTSGDDGTSFQCQQKIYNIEIAFSHHSLVLVRVEFVCLFLPL